MLVMFGQPGALACWGWSLFFVAAAFGGRTAHMKHLYHGEWSLFLFLFKLFLQRKHERIVEMWTCKMRTGCVLNINKFMQETYGNIKHDDMKIATPWRFRWAPCSSHFVVVVHLLVLAVFRSGGQWSLGSWEYESVNGLTSLTYYDWLIWHMGVKDRNLCKTTTGVMMMTMMMMMMRRRRRRRRFAIVIWCLLIDY